MKTPLRWSEAESTTAAEVMRANQLRLSFAWMAYLLVSAVRRRALGLTRLARATCGTIR